MPKTVIGCLLPESNDLSWDEAVVSKQAAGRMTGSVKRQQLTFIDRYGITTATGPIAKSKLIEENMLTYHSRILLESA